MDEIKHITFNDLPILDIYGNSVGQISGELSANDLGEYLVDQWVGYVECHKCPRVDTCKYADYENEIDLPSEIRPL